MNTFVLDTNIISFYLKDMESVVKNIQKMVALKHEILIAPFAYYEVKRGLIADNAKNRLKKFIDFCGLFEIGKLDNSILDIATDVYIELKNKGRPADEIDIMIAAFCKKYNYTLVTNNTKHFDSISNLLLVDWTI